MKTAEELKNIVKEKYTEIVTITERPKSSSCCGTIESSCCGGEDDVTFALDYSKLPGYNKDADYALGCGIPTDVIEIKKGDTVLDLGAGAGNDVFVARSFVGETGYVIGIDMTEAMIAKANDNKAKVGYNNVDFRFGEIEDMPVDDNSIDVVISNCVLNLVPDKVKAFAEIYRVTKPGGKFSVSDIVLENELEDSIKEVATLYAGCVSGAILQENYIKLIEDAGFRNVEIKKATKKVFTEEILKKELSPEEFDRLEEKETSVLSITVVGEKPNKCC